MPLMSELEKTILFMRLTSTPEGRVKLAKEICAASIRQGEPVEEFTSTLNDVIGNFFTPLKGPQV